MKALALFSLVALSLSAQAPDFKPAPETIAAISGDAKNLTPEEQVSFALAIMKAQGARINMLEKLIESKAGADDAVQIDKANQEQESMRQSLIKRHGACEGGQWNFTTKAWVCPPNEPAKPK